MKKPKGVIRLTEEESRKVAEAMADSPQPPSPAAVAALKRYRRTVSSDVNPWPSPIQNRVNRGH